MRIVIGESYFRVLDPKEQERRMPYPPIGTLYAATILRKMGHDVHFFDAMLSSDPGEFIETISAQKPDLVIIYEDEFNYLTKMCLSNMRGAALSFISHARSITIPTIVYSSDAMDHPELYLGTGSDAVISGEGEITLREVVHSYESGSFLKERSEIKGLKYSENNSVKATPPRETIKDLDSLPDPDYDFVDVEAYKDIWQREHGYFSLNISTTRGCPFYCNWCAKPIYGKRYHSRSPARVARQMKYLSKTYDVEHFWITDDIFGLKPGWIAAFAEVYSQNNGAVPYKCLSRADLLLRGDTINDLERSGCRTIWIGAESGSQKILNAMEKGITVPQIYEATREIHAAGMEVAFFLQFGYTGEEWEDIKLTIKMVKECMPEDIGISVSYPLPGTKFYESVKKELGKKQNWNDSNDLAMMFHGTYSTEFYRKLHSFVHHTFRLRWGLKTMKKLHLKPGKKSLKVFKKIALVFYYFLKISIERQQLKALRKAQL